MAMIGKWSPKGLLTTTLGHRPRRLLPRFRVPVLTIDSTGRSAGYMSTRGARRRTMSPRPRLGPALPRSVRRLPDFLFRRALPAPQERRGIEHDVVVDEVRAIPAEPYRVAIRTVLVVRQQRIVAAP